MLCRIHQWGNLGLQFCFSCVRILTINSTSLILGLLGSSHSWVVSSSCLSRNLSQVVEFIAIKLFITSYLFSACRIWGNVLSHSWCYTLFCYICIFFFLIFFSEVYWTFPRTSYGVNNLPPVFLFPVELTSVFYYSLIAAYIRFNLLFFLRWIWEFSSFLT